MKSRKIERCSFLGKGAWSPPSLGKKRRNLSRGFATILLTIFIDPQLGLITDRAMHEEESRQQLGRIYIMLMGARFLGTLAAQLIIFPAAYMISMVVQWI